MVTSIFPRGCQSTRHLDYSVRPSNEKTTNRHSATRHNLSHRRRGRGQTLRTVSIPNRHLQKKVKETFFVQIGGDWTGHNAIIGRYFSGKCALLLCVHNFRIGSLQGFE